MKKYIFCHFAPANRWEHLIYQFGEHEHLIQTVIKDGLLAYDKSA